jgi:hypothetical protein
MLCGDRSENRQAQDIGRIDFYVRYFEDNIKQADDNPAIGIVVGLESPGSTFYIAVRA